MTREDLYDIAFQFRDTAIWKKLTDTEVFAIRLSNGEFGYISLLGNWGDYIALCLYIGEKGVQSFRLMVDRLKPSGAPFKDHELMVQDDSLQIILGDEDELFPEEWEEIRMYAKRKPVKLLGSNAYPQFVKYEPGFHQWKLETEEERISLHEAALATCLLAKELETKTPKELGIVPVTPQMREVPLLEINGDTVVVAGRAPFPEKKEVHYEFVTTDNQVLFASVKKLTRKGTWESELVCGLDPLQDSTDGRPYYPMLLLLTENSTYHLLAIPFKLKEKNDPQKILMKFANTWKSEGYYPKEIICSDERTYALLKDFCEKTNVRVSICKEDMFALANFKKTILDNYMEEQIGDGRSEEERLAEAILAMDVSKLRAMPQPFLDQIRMMLAQNAFPQDVAKEIAEKMKGL